MTGHCPASTDAGKSAPVQNEKQQGSCVPCFSILVTTWLVLREMTVLVATVAPGVRQEKFLISATLLRGMSLDLSLPDFYCPSFSNGFVST